VAKFFKSIALIMIITPLTSFSMPIDWHGKFGVDTTLIDTFAKSDYATSFSNAGTQQIPLASGGHANASFQSYILRLAPDIIINDSASIKGEITTGYGRGGRLGDATKQNKSNDMGHALYMQNNASSDDSTQLHLTKIYMELYSDTATYVIGRHDANYGLGAVINSGKNLWDRHTFVRDGITAKIKLGNFQLDPYMGKVSSDDSLTRATNSKEYGTSIVYENHQKGTGFGLLYGKKINNHANNNIVGEADGTSRPLGETNVKITDLYFKQTFGDFTFQVEVPIMSGEIGYVYNNTDIAKYKAKAVVFESKYNMSKTLTLGINAGSASGSAGSGSSFEAMYLNPNYQIAHLMFRYNMLAVSDPNTYSVYDSYIVNAKYAKLYVKYLSENWDFGGALVHAIANEVAAGGNSTAFNHLTGEAYTSTIAQNDDMGYELDFDLNYKWNSSITIGTLLGYHFVGDYYTFTNDSAHTLKKHNSFVGQLNTIINF